MHFLEVVKSHNEFRDNCCPEANMGGYYTYEHLSLEFGIPKDDLIEHLQKSGFCEQSGSPTLESLNNCYFIPGSVFNSEGEKYLYFITEKGRSQVSSLLSTQHE